MIAALAALAPVGLVIALGWALKRSGFPGDGFWRPAEVVAASALAAALTLPVALAIFTSRPHTRFEGGRG